MPLMFSWCECSVQGYMVLFGPNQVLHALLHLLLQFGAKPKRALLAARPFTVSAAVPKKPAMPQVRSTQQQCMQMLLIRHVLMCLGSWPQALAAGPKPDGMQMQIPPSQPLAPAYDKLTNP